MPRLDRVISLLVWGVVLSIIFSAVLPTSVSAQNSPSDNPTACQFQPASFDRRPTLEVIRQITGTGSNITWDLTYIGLHRWYTNQIPAVDYLVETTVPFKNGGIIAKTFYDTAGGGYSLEIDGRGPCQGWRVFIGHLAYDPRTVYKAGQSIGPDEVIGKPSCSGFEGSCTETNKKTGTVPPHNHYGVGYWSNVFDFKDKTKPAFFGGYWWVHPSRLEGAVTSEASQPLVPEADESLNTPVEQFTGEVSVTAPAVFKTGTVERLLAPAIPFRNLLLVLCGLLFILFVAGILYSSDFRRNSVPFVLVIVVVLFFFFGLEKARASTLTALAPPRESDVYITRSSGGQEAFVFGQSEPVPSPEVKSDPSSSCAQSTFPDEIKRWCGLIDKYAAEFDPLLIASIMLQESGGDPGIMSNSGAVGLLQVMPRDGISAGFMCDNGPCFADRPTIAQLLDPETNVSTGVGILRQKVNYYGSLRDGLLHYGPLPKHMLETYGSEYYYADLVLSIYDNHR